MKKYIMYCTDHLQSTCALEAVFTSYSSNGANFVSSSVKLSFPTHFSWQLPLDFLLCETNIGMQHLSLLMSSEIP